MWIDKREREMIVDKKKWKQTTISLLEFIFIDSQSIDRSIWFDKHTLTSIHRHSQNTQEGEKLKHTY